MSSEMILFVDDEEPLRHAAAQTLQLADFDVTCFADAESALLAALLVHDAVVAFAAGPDQPLADMLAKGVEDGYLPIP